MENLNNFLHFICIRIQNAFAYDSPWRPCPAQVPHNSRPDCSHLRPVIGAADCGKDIPPNAVWSEEISVFRIYGRLVQSAVRPQLAITATLGSGLFL